MAVPSCLFDRGRGCATDHFIDSLTRASGADRQTYGLGISKTTKAELPSDGQKKNAPYEYRRYHLGDQKSISNMRSTAKHKLGRVIGARAVRHVAGTIFVSRRFPKSARRAGHMRPRASSRTHFTPQSDDRRLKPEGALGAALVTQVPRPRLGPPDCAPPTAALARARRCRGGSVTAPRDAGDCAPSRLRLPRLVSPLRTTRASPSSPRRPERGPVRPAIRPVHPSARRTP